MKVFWLRLWKLLSPSHKQIKALVFLTMVFELSRLVGPYILKLIIDLITNFDPNNASYLLLLIFALFASGEVVAVIDYFLDKKIIRVLSDNDNYLATNAHRQLLSLSLSFHEKENTGNKITKVIRGVDKIINLLGNVFWDVSPTIVQVIITTTVLFAVDFRFGLVFLILVPLFIFLSLKANRKVYPCRRSRQDDEEESSGKMTQAIININTVKSFVQEKREEREYETIRKRIRNSFFTEMGIILKFNWSRNLIIDLGRVGILLFGVYLVWSGGITIGSLVFIITISEKALTSLFRISRLYDRIMESSEAINRLYFLSREQSDIANPKNGIKPKTLIGQIEFKNVDFIYPGSAGSALKSINLKINSGCVTALVGPSGGGKTTIARMIYRHYDPQKGNVLIDGQDLRQYDLYEFRKFIAIVPQEVEIFDTSIRDNIAYANPKASLREVKAAAKIANAEEFIMNLKSGYDTLVGERGVKLSGGQRQRVGIARAILANPKILIFDEATSNLDSYSEKLIQEAIERISKGRTMIIIAHRLSTIKKADKIFVLEEGRLVEAGSHYELAQTKGGLYAKLLSLQVMGEVE